MSTQIYGNPVYDEFLSPMDRSNVKEDTLTADQKFWRDNGYIIFRNAIDTEVLERYMQAREARKLGNGGWPNNHPFTDSAAVRDLVLHKPMMERIQKVIGYPIAVHFNLSGFTSTDRGWHQDDYMYSRTVMASGVAAWISLGNITEEMGPFEFVPGSHKWPWMRKWLVTRHLKSEVVDNPEGKYEFWAHYAEKYVNPACSRRIREMNAPRKVFMARPGDVLFWHGGLLHRGLPPIEPGIPRPSMIAHYLDPRRHDCGGNLQRAGNGEYYYSF
ncbi:hypothetical protein WL90_06760 [Burkholderia cenocepacia]|nr:hypothetical protein WL90_06760 [Burkholderia cenocepacia]KWF74618.1 hypothetical protein WL89_31190 [Burkholderia cenocepacia]